MTEQQELSRSTSEEVRPAVKIEFAVPFRRVPAPMTLVAEPAPELTGKAPRIARLLALAHKLDELLRSGPITDYGELARL